MKFSTPHYEKLVAVLENQKLPSSDKKRINRAISQYKTWVSEVATQTKKAGTINSLEGGGGFIKEVMSLLRSYKMFVDVETIFDSPNDFLYRQKGQLKFDNTIIEEFLPYIVYPFLRGRIDEGFRLGPRSCFSSLFFESGLKRPSPGGGMNIRTKDQDFAVSRELYLKSSFEPKYGTCSEQKTHLSYIASELKTNLDKTMFQEACATAHDVKTAVVGSKYYLVCEWLDMTPLSTATTDIDEVLILRGKRINSNVRSQYASYEGRKKHRQDYIEYLTNNPIRDDIFERLISHIVSVFNDKEPIEDDVLRMGFF